LLTKFYTGHHFTSTVTVTKTELLLYEEYWFYLHLVLFSAVDLYRQAVVLANCVNGCL